MSFINLGHETDLPIGRKNLFALISILILILITYSNTCQSSWHLDDYRFLENETLQLSKLTWPEFKKVLIKGQAKLFRPISSLTLALNYYFGKKDVFGYHIANIIIHILSSFFLFLFIHNLLKSPSIFQKYKENAYGIALLSTTLWAINPVNTQAVTYIIQRMASMAGLFYIMSMYFFLKTRLNHRPYQKTALFILCALSFTFAIGSKENTVLLPVSLLLVETLILKKNSPYKWVWNNYRILLVISIAIIMLIFLLLYIRMRGEPLSFLNQYNGRVFNLQERLLTEPRIILFYLSLLFYPISTRLSLSHDISISTSLLSPPETLLSILIITFLITIAFLISTKWAVISLSILFFFINHIVESTIIPLELIFEHRNYIPSMLLFIPPVILVVKLISYFSYKPLMRNVIILCTIGILISIGCSTYIRNSVWMTGETLWLDCIEKYPNLWRPYHNLGVFYSDTKQTEKAIETYHMALNKKVLNKRLDQKYFPTYYNIGVEYLKLGLYEKARQNFLLAEKANPGFARIQLHMGFILFKQNKINKAKERFKRAISYQPNLRKDLARFNDIPESLLDFSQTPLPK